MKFIKGTARVMVNRSVATVDCIRAFGAQKIFCIGLNKTGTTSLEFAFRELGYSIGNQRTGELLADKHYYAGRFKPIIKHCQYAQVFQDIPFSFPETYKHLDRAFPGSKFILTVRDDAEQWYDSITRFHAKMFGTNGNVPNVDQLLNAEYARKGFMYNVLKLYGSSDDDLYNKQILIEHYEKHNRSVISYFRHRPKDLLIINVAESTAYQKFLSFLNVKSDLDAFPWKNRT